MHPVQRRCSLNSRGSLRRNLALENIQLRLTKKELEEHPPSITEGAWRRDERTDDTRPMTDCLILSSERFPCPVSAQTEYQREGDLDLEREGSLKWSGGSSRIRWRGTSRQGEERKGFFGKSVRVEEITPFGLVTASVLGGLVMPVDDGQIEIGRRVVDGLISTVAVCTMGNTECKACMSASARTNCVQTFVFWDAMYK